MQMRDREQGPQRWFKRSGDGVIFPMSDEYHCHRLLQEGWREISEEEAKADRPSAPVAAPTVDPRDAEIALLKEQVARLIATSAPKQEEQEHAVQTNDVESGGRGQGPNRRPGQR